MSNKADELRENLQYVSDMIEQLKVVSGLQNGAMLLHLLDMAKLEADQQIERMKGSEK